MTLAESASPPPIPSIPPVAESAGAWLRRERERRCLTLQHVARDLHITVAAVAALESQDLTRLPPPVFLRGFLRKYSRLLGLPEDQILTAYPIPPAAPLRSVNGPTVATLPNRPRTSRWPLAAGLGGALLLALVIGALLDQDEPAAEPATPAATVVPLPTVRAPAAGEGGDGLSRVTPSKSPPRAGEDSVDQPFKLSVPHQGTLVLHFKGDAWARVNDADGKALLNEAGQRGTTRTITGRCPLRVSLSRPDSVELRLDGRTITPPAAGKRGWVQFRVGEPGAG